MLLRRKWGLGALAAFALLGATYFLLAVLMPLPCAKNPLVAAVDWALNARSCGQPFDPETMRPR